MHQTLKLIRLIVPLVVCLGLISMAQAVGPDTEGNIPGANNGEGVGVLVSRTTGVWNTGTGFEALNHLTAGNQNTATGLRALFSDINGGFNTATGVYSLYSNTTGFFNSATGGYSLTHNTSGNNNTANGYSALYFNTDRPPKHGHWLCCALQKHHRQKLAVGSLCSITTLTETSIRPWPWGAFCK